MSGDEIQKVRTLLLKEFDARHVKSLLAHFSRTVGKFLAKDWEGTAEKAGKFIEAVAKALVVRAGKAITNPRHFSAGNELRLLEQVAGYPDALRLVIPRAGIFVYEIVSNRGGRHDAHDIDANELDARVLVPIVSWILAEMVRFCGQTNPEEAMELIKELTEKKYPHFEDIGGRSYINLDGMKPGEIALLLLYRKYPSRISRPVLVDLVKRHGATESAAVTAVHRLKSLVDDDGDGWLLRGLGRQKAEQLLEKQEAG
jgi:hypothetical protein